METCDEKSERNKDGCREQFVGQEDEGPSGSTISGWSLQGEVQGADRRGDIPRHPALRATDRRWTIVCQDFGAKKDPERQTNCYEKIYCDL